METAFIKLIESGNTEGVKTLLAIPEIQKDINKGYGYIKNTPLHWACLNGHLDIVKELLKNNMDVNKSNEYGYTPLHWACENRHLEIVKELLKNNADPNKSDKDGDTPLHWACENGNLEIVKELLKNNADINKGNKNTQKPLHWACKNGNLEIVKELIYSGAELNKTTVWFETPLDLAKKHGYPEIVKVLEEAMKDKKPSFNTNTPKEKDEDLSVETLKAEIVEAINTALSEVLKKWEAKGFEKV